MPKRPSLHTPLKGDAIIPLFAQMKKWKPIFAQDHKGSSRTDIRTQVVNLSRKKKQKWRGQEEGRIRRETRGGETEGRMDSPETVKGDNNTCARFGSITPTQI